MRRYGGAAGDLSDWRNVYQRRATTAEAVAGVRPETQFGRMCAKLGIRLIGASSPQAKGRVERHHGIHQDRLVKKLRLAGVADYEAANGYLETSYLAEHNARFAREPAAAADLHRDWRGLLELQRVFCLESERVVSNDLVVRFAKRLLQLEPRRNQGLGPGARVLVEQQRDGALRVVFEEGEVAFREIEPAAPGPHPQRPPARPRVSRKPAPEHPWRQSYKTLKRPANSERLWK